MQEFNTKLLNKRDEARGIVTFYFEKPEGFSYIAGQYAYFTLPELKFPDSRGKIRHFTLSSSPTEPHIAITIRMREESGYKKTLDTLEIGTEIGLRGPTGDFALENEDLSTEQVMIAGGIGITPYRSIIKYVSNKNFNIPITLIYSNSTPSEIAFREELTQISKTNPNIKVHMTVTKPEEITEPWEGLTGRIDEKMLSLLTTDYSLPAFWLCGPPGFVQAMEEMMEKMQVPQDRIKVEKFTGY